MQFSGAFTALVTPFAGGEVDEEAYRGLIEWQIEQGIDGVVPCGTTGESATLSHDEHKRVISICVDQVKGRVPVIAGAGSNNTREAIELTQAAKSAGADGALLITPYYNKPTQDGLVAHFKAIAEKVSMPFIVYNVPGRTSVNLLPETLYRMQQEIPEVVGTKDATADMKQVARIIELCGEDFMTLSGDDFTVLPLVALGGCGVISVVSNVAPALMAKLVKATRENDLATARKAHIELNPLNRAMFLSTNPIPAKTSLAMMGKLPKAEMRLPLVNLSDSQDEQLREILLASGLL
jgi:4-hydroxy-tetrahydrodipicolinate synthase